MEISFKAIGKIKAEESHVIEIDSEYTPGLSGLNGFSHVIIVWYANKPAERNNSNLLIKKPYRLAPDRLGVFATRSEYRPNNICISIAPVLSVDEKNGLINLIWTDAEDGTPLN
jgi:tRNA (adenine37-N6)-methyltransferase